MWRALLQDVELMPQHQDFGFKPSSRFETVAQRADEKEGNCEHPAIMFSFAGDRESNGWSFRNRQHCGNDFDVDFSPYRNTRLRPSATTRCSNLPTQHVY